jgi:hypothetical protein
MILKLRGTDAWSTRIGGRSGIVSDAAGLIDIGFVGGKKDAMIEVMKRT